MYEETTVGVVVPAYNEEGFVGEVIETVPEFVDRVYAIDDCSSDGTWQEIVETANRVNVGSEDQGVDPSDSEPAAETGVVEGALADGGDDASFTEQVVPIRHRENRGVGGAIKTGYTRARRDGIGVTAVMGGDGQMDPDELEAVIEPIVSGDADYAKGNRLIHSSDREEMPGLRYVGNLILSSLTKIASGYWYVGDPQNGYTAISSEALGGVGIEEMFEFYGYCNDLLVRLSASGYRVVDVPVAARYRDEESHIDYRTYVPRVSAMLLRMFLWRLAFRRENTAENVRSGLYVGGAAAVLAGLVGVHLPRWTGRKTEPENADSVADDDASPPSDGTAGRERSGSRLERAGTAALGVLMLIAGMLADARINRPLNGKYE